MPNEPWDWNEVDWNDWLNDAPIDAIDDNINQTIGEERGLFGSIGDSVGDSIGSTFDDAKRSVMTLAILYIVLVTKPWK